MSTAISDEEAVQAKTPRSRLKIPALSVQGFRSIRTISLSQLGRVNLITGRNNSGKSSLLEALRILATDGSPATLATILHYREEDLGEGEEGGRAWDSEGLAQVSSLFSGFPKLSEIREPILITTTTGERGLHLSITLGWFSEQRDPDGMRRLVAQQAELFSPGETMPALVVEIGGGGTKRILPLDYFRRFRSRAYRPDLPEEQRTPCVFLSPFSAEHTSSLGPLWDKIALSEREKDVVEALRIIAPEIEAVSMVGGESTRLPRTAIVKARGFSRPMPLKSFGDGLNRLFGIALSLVNAKDGLLLIDEVENGMHHAIQAEVWDAVFRVAAQLNVQVFASTHSWDCIEAFQQAAARTPEDGVLVRLTRKGDQVLPTVFREDELSIATRDHIELR
jgi:hypothetical protein